MVFVVFMVLFVVIVIFSFVFFFVLKIIESLLIFVSVFDGMLGVFNLLVVVWRFRDVLNGDV